MSHAAFLLPIVITAANNAIRLTEGAGTNTATITPGTYYLRGDGAADDLCLAIRTAFAAAGASANTYTISVTPSADPNAPTATISIARTGGDTFAILWADALTTFDEALLGFTNVNTSNNSTAKVSTLSPSSLWVAPADTQDEQLDQEADGFIQRANSGVVRDGLFGGPYDVLRLVFEMVDGRRAHSDHISADPNRGFDKLWARWLAGRPCEMHNLEHTSWPTLGLMSSATVRGPGKWHLGEASRDQYRRRRKNRATSLWSWELELWKKV